jgi:K(+)-stimulated pyrophosphate-energized sodium pump
VDITAKAALRAMILPGVLAVGLPIAVGLVFRYVRAEDYGEFEKASGWLAVAGMVMIGTIVGILMATFFNNVGGAWDNAKKYIEAGNLKADETVLGKGTDAHKAAVVGDTVGDPFKDTAGPSLHVLIKLLATITLVMAPLFIP